MHVSLILVNDSSFKILLIQSIPVVSDFPEVSLDDLPGDPPKREIDPGIDIFLDTRRIYILPHRMAQLS